MKIMEQTKKPAILMAKVFVLDQGKILIIRRSGTDPRWAFVWDLPGGAIEHGEDPKDTAAREAFEEAGQVLSSLELVDISSLSEGDYALTITYRAAYPGTPIELSFEHDQYQWVTLEGLESTNIPEKYKIAARKLPL